jgi:hypothetical protein
MLKNENIKVIDNALNQKDFDYVKGVMWSDSFPWSMTQGYAVSDDDIGFKFSHMFYNGLYYRSNFFELLNPIFNILQPRAFIRIQAIVSPRADKLVKTGYHSDITNCVTAIYYLNTCNGPLHFKDHPSVDAVENRLVIFNSNLIHSGTKCTDSDRRTLINFNYYERQEADNEFTFN